MTTQTKQRLQKAIGQFKQDKLRENSLHLLATLGYKSERQIAMGNSPKEFLDTFDEGSFRQDKASFTDWETIEILCQITDDEINQSSQMILLDSKGKTVDNAIIESYLFIALGLKGIAYNRTELAQITREVNKLFSMPVMVLFRYGDLLTLSIINRRLHKRERSKDVLEKVTLIKDIRIEDPHRAHVEILFDLSLDELFRVHQFNNFVEMHKAWQKTLDSSELNKRFFKEIANWYFWAVNEVVFPEDAGPEETRNATSVIQLITRLIFVWFLKEKGLVPDILFNKRELDGILKWEDPQDSTFYKAILQNLFFATLNQEMNTEAKPDNRKFRGTRQSGQDQHYLIHNVYRYERYFQKPEKALALFADIPFLNGGLFECLDKKGDDKVIRVDGFSDREDNPLVVPDELFYGEERPIDLNQTFGTTGKGYKVRGIIKTLDRYKFTIAENTPIEEEIALDPELLGKVFENLLAAYNPETGTTARKQTGSFYTPREIVDYMVDESLIAYLTSKCDTDEDRLRHLFAYNEVPHQFDEVEVKRLVDAIDHVNILDPACGSGAFPMGILHKLVEQAKYAPGHPIQLPAESIQEKQFGPVSIRSTTRQNTPLHSSQMAETAVPFLENPQSSLPLPSSVSWQSLETYQGDDLAVGFDAQEIITLNLANTPHILLAESSGTGKTRRVLRTLVAQALAQGVSVVLLNESGADFTPFYRHTNVTLIRGDVYDYTAFLEATIEEMHRRESILRATGVSEWPRLPEELRRNDPPILIAIDKLLSLALMMSPREQKAFWALLATYASRARKLAMGSIGALTDPTYRILGNGLAWREQCTARITFRVAKASVSRAVLDKSGAEALADGQFLAMLGSPGLVNGTAVNPSDEELASYLARHPIPETSNPEWVRTTV